MEQNKTKSYILYALGEIALVMIGILLALQVNNWNEERKTGLLEVKVLEEISSDLKLDVISLEGDIQLNQRALQAIEIIQNALNTDQAYHDSLGSYFTRFTLNTTYTIKTSGYENLKNRGFEIVDNDSVRKAITDLYASTYPFLKELQLTSDRLTYDYFIPEYLEYFERINNAPGNGSENRRFEYHPADFEALKKDKEFKRLLNFMAQIKSNNIYDIKLTFEKLYEARDIINEYLNTISKQ